MPPGLRLSPEPQSALLRCTDCAACPDAARHILWSCLPIASYGDVTRARIVTVGLNPSDNLFYQRSTRVARPVDGRLPMVEDFGAKTRSQVPLAALPPARRQQEQYFTQSQAAHPWFRPLREILGALGPEWTYESGWVAHVDTAACATDQWATLPVKARQQLQQTCHRHCLATLSESPLTAVLLWNGTGVAGTFAAERTPAAEGELVSEIIPRQRLRWSQGIVQLPDGSTRHYLGWNLALQRTAADLRRELGQLLRAMILP